MKTIKAHLHNLKHNKIRLDPKNWKSGSCPRCVKIFRGMSFEERKNMIGLIDYCIYQGWKIEVKWFGPSVFYSPSGYYDVYFNNILVAPNSSILTQICYSWIKHDFYGGMDLKEYLEKMLG